MPAIFRHNDSNSMVINDFVDSCEPVPLMTGKNRDKTLLVQQFDMVLSNNYPKPDKGDIIRVYQNQGTAFPFFKGTVLKTKTIFGADQYVVTVVSDFKKLQDKRLVPQNLHDAIAATSDKTLYIAADNFGYPSVRVLWVIEQMFLTAGLNLTINQFLEGTFIKEISYESFTTQMLIKHLVFDENILYALNQGSACNPPHWQTFTPRAPLIPSYWDFISEFCSHFGAHIMLRQAGTPGDYELIKAGSPAPAYFDDLTYKKDEKEILGAVGGYIHNLRFHPDRAKYDATVETNLIDHNQPGGEQKTSISTISNFVYMFARTATPISYENGDTLGINNYPNLNYEADLYLQNRIASETSDFLETTMKIDNYLSLSTQEAALNMETEEAENIWVEED